MAHTADGGRALVVAHQDEGALGVQVQCPLQGRKEGKEDVPETIDGAGPVGDEVPPTGEQELQFGEVALAGNDLREVGSHPGLFGDDVSITGIGLELPRVGVAHTLHGQGREVEDSADPSPTKRQKQRRAAPWLVDGPHRLLRQGEDFVDQLKEVDLVVFYPAGEDLLSRSVEHVSPVELFAGVDADPHLVVHEHLHPSVAGDRVPVEYSADGSLCSESWTSSPISMSGRSLLERPRAIPFKPSLAAEQNKPSSAPLGVIQELYPNDKHNDKEQTMCRWLAYSGSPILLEELLYKPEHSLIDQSLHSRLGVETTNGDGFGVGWYGPDAQTPAVFHSIEPAWNDRNLREVAGHVQSPLFLAHIRASTGTAVQQTNCHPFRHDRWLWVHNGLVRDFHRVKRELALAVDESLYPQMEGSTDSEMLFYLALTFGLEENPPAAVERMVGHVEEVGHRHGTEHPIQMTIGTTDGSSVWAFRYSSEGKSRSLYYSTDMRSVREMYPERPRLQEASDETRIIVSEPIVDLPGAWNEVPESSYGVVRDGEDELHEFRPLR